MRKFIVSDLHGDGNVYKAIMDYLERVNDTEDITLYINGDLIDRGLESADMLLDVRERLITGKPFKIEYLAGNHELMMYECFEKRKKGITTCNDPWFDNGGWRTDYGLEDRFKTCEEELEAIQFINDLKIYHKFEEKIGDKPIVLVHSAVPVIVEDECKIKLSDNDPRIMSAVWTREFDPWIPFRCRIGDKRFFSIVGHTPNLSVKGYIYRPDQNFLNIDGGCARYVSGLFQDDHVPLVEVCNGYLRILVFNNNNEIIMGVYFDGRYEVPFSDEELNSDRKYLNHDFKPKRLVLLEDDVIDYEK